VSSLAPLGDTPETHATGPRSAAGDPFTSRHCRRPARRRRVWSRTRTRISARHHHPHRHLRVDGARGPTGPALRSAAVWCVRVVWLECVRRVTTTRRARARRRSPPPAHGRAITHALSYVRRALARPSSSPRDSAPAAAVRRRRRRPRASPRPGRRRRARRLPLPFRTAGEPRSPSSPAAAGHSHRARRTPGAELRDGGHRASSSLAPASVAGDVYDDEYNMYMFIIILLLHTCRVVYIHTHIWGIYAVILLVVLIVLLQ
jgi:hypothetical protein